MIGLPSFLFFCRLVYFITAEFILREDFPFLNIRGFLGLPSAMYRGGGQALFSYRLGVTLRRVSN